MPSGTETESTPIPASLTVVEVAESLSVSPRRVKTLISHGELAAFDVSAPSAVRPSLRVTPAALAAFVAAKTVVSA